MASEITFWVVLVAGLVARYPLGRPRPGMALLVSAPLVDLVLLAATVADLQAGATPGPFHSLAAVYLGVSVGFGHQMVRWADERFAHRFAGGPAPARPARGRPERALRRREGWRRHLVAWSVGSVLLAAGALMVGDLSEARAFTDRIWQWTIVLAIDAAWSLGPAARLRLRPGRAAWGPDRSRRATRA